MCCILRSGVSRCPRSHDELRIQLSLPAASFWTSSNWLKRIGLDAPNMLIITKSKQSIFSDSPRRLKASTPARQHVRVLGWVADIQRRTSEQTQDQTVSRTLRTHADPGSFSTDGGVVQFVLWTVFPFFKTMNMNRPNFRTAEVQVCTF